MSKKLVHTCLFCVVAAALPVSAQDDEAKKQKEELEELAIIEQKILVPMRDGVRLSTDVYRPRDVEGPLPTIFWRTPYNFNVLRGPRVKFLKASLENGYAFVIQNERGKFHSEGDLEDPWACPAPTATTPSPGSPSQEWSSGKVGTIGCSSVGRVAAGAGGDGPSGPRRDGADGLRRRHRPRRRVLRAGQLVPRRRLPDALRHLALRRAEHAAAAAAGGPAPGRRRSAVALLRPGAGHAGRGVGGAHRAPSAGHHDGRGGWADTASTPSS